VYITEQTPAFRILKNKSLAIPIEQLCTFRTKMPIDDAVIGLYSFYSKTNHTKKHTSLLLNDAYISGKVRGHTLDRKAKSEFGFFPAIVKQVFIEPELVSVLTSSCLHLSLRLRPVDLLFGALVNKIRYSQLQPQVAQNQINMFRTEVILEQKLASHYSQDLIKFVADFGPLDSCAMLLQILCSPKERFYVFSHKDQTVKERMHETTLLNAYQNTNSSRVMNNSSRLHDGFPEDKRFSFEIQRLNPLLEEQALELFFKLGSYSLIKIDHLERDWLRRQEQAYGRTFFSDGQQAKSENWKEKERLFMRLNESLPSNSLILDSIFVYFSRLTRYALITRPIWNASLFDTDSVRKRKGEFVEVLENIPLKTLDLIHDKLTNLLTFLLDHQQNLLSERIPENFKRYHWASINPPRSEKLIRISPKTSELVGSVAELFNKYLQFGQLSNKELNLEDLDMRQQFCFLIDRSLQVIRFYQEIVQRKRSMSFFSERQLFQLVNAVFKDLVLHSEGPEIMNKYLLLLLIFENQANVEPLSERFRLFLPSCFTHQDAHFAVCFSK